MTKAPPMEDDVDFALQLQRQGTDFKYYRGTARVSQQPVLGVGIDIRLSSPQSHDRLRHEYALSAQLDARWAARPIAIANHQGQEVLILEDPGGEPLDWLIARRQEPFNLSRFLRIAIGLAAAIGEVHGQGLIHKDIKPANALVDGLDRVWLTGFGIASQLPRERQAVSPPETIAGTLAYMAPEQTGRVNRTIDSRSDLYSLGVTLYETLTGELPFKAREPLEWVHSHIARPPQSPGETAADIPEVVSAVIMKLLAKSAEERYQTAKGLERDLRRCLEEWEGTGSIDSFALGEHDQPGRLLVSEKLYGRALESKALLAPFRRIAATGRAEFILVSGRPGIGKSSIIQELYGRLAPSHGFFASGKFDQYLRDIPYATLAQAFRGLVKQILCGSHRELQEWREMFVHALGANASLIVDLVPDLARVIGEQPPAFELSAQDSQRRFQAVLRRFIGVFSRPGRPLALFLDDLQWADAATLDLLHDLLTYDGISHLLLIGAYRDNEVDDAHPLKLGLDTLRRSGVEVGDILLRPLDSRELTQLIGNALRCSEGSAQPLARLVQEKAGGNPFFVIQFLQNVEEEGLLSWDHGNAKWIWDADAILAKVYSDNVIDLMVANLSRLPADTLDVLCRLACFGVVAKVDVLAELCLLSSAELHDVLREAVRAGVVLYSDDSYAFQHDRIHEAAYLLTPSGTRAEIHLRIGRILVARTSPDEIDGVIFQIVSQFNQCSDLLVSFEERAHVAQFNLVAAKRSKKAAAYASALTFIAAARALLSDDCWTRQYYLAFGLELNCAECEFLTGDLASAEARLSMLANRAEGLVDQASVTCLQVDLYIISARPGRAVDVGLEYLQLAGFVFSPHPTARDVRQAYEGIWRELGSRRIEDLIALPAMDDTNIRATIDVLNKLVLSALYEDPRLHQLLIALMVHLSMKHGNSAASCVAYVSLGRVLITEYGDFSAALQFGRLSLALLDRPGFDTFAARVHFSYGTGISSWSQHLRVGRSYIQRALDVASADGDLPYIGYCHSNIVGNLLSSGDPLAEVDNVALEGLSFARRSGSRIAAAFIIGQLLLIRSLTGSTCDFKTIDDNAFDADDFEQSLNSSSYPKLVSEIYWSRRMQAFVFEGNYPSALAAGARAQNHFWTPRPNVEGGEYHFYAGLARAGSIGNTLSTLTDHEMAHLEALKTHVLQLKAWEAVCPENFESRAALVGAELARLEIRELDAERLYAQAIRSARSSGFVQNEALAYELASRSFASRGFEDIAEMYLAKARDAYARWGANGVLRRLKVGQPEPAIPGVGEKGNPLPYSDAQFDVATALKASQALSSEMLLPQLIERLMRIAVEHAGAERGVLVLFSEGGERIAAEAVTGQDAITVSARHSIIASMDLPHSIVQYVMRTHEPVLMDDALRDEIYSRDEYVQRKRSRSVLCLPIVRQMKVIGELYLENGLTPGAFTAERVAVLDLLASQAAISLENAELFTDLQRSETFLTQGQRISHTGSFGWRAASGEFFWSSELYNILEYKSGVKASAELALARIHADDRDRVAKLLEAARHQGRDFESEHRLSMPDGRIKYVHTTGRAVGTEDLDFVGSVRDITERVRTEETLRQVRSDLAHVARVTTLNAMTASIAHEVNQPLSGILTNANTGARFLAADPPDLAGVAETIRRTIRDAKRAGDVISGLRAMFQNHASTTATVDLNEAAREVIALSAGELVRGKTIMETAFADDLPPVRADRVQLQQVILNLLLNAVEAMADVPDRPRKVLLRTRFQEDGVRLDVVDSGIGVPPETAQRLFDAFYTTKRNGMGVGLSICRSIIEGLDGRLWVTTNDGPGTTFSFTIPPANDGTSHLIDRARVPIGPPAQI